ncbi:nucleoside hydrolase [Mesorhizobium sp. L-8-10]|uniref:nucleoside hydrolase n=1 Tax=unclassified Mesorhizobium TaxID=325217 RepID=UPI00192661CC|nr:MULTISPECIES: nucleoside hydrolase [unclassified Mesorhizobium]BCH25363.1 nucleoside hydrolase [Mesorhizobium sp. L-8-3]BCH33372.1 nucleoside hydrolase [Mesorhizobium sp. L-8-10]
MPTKVIFDTDPGVDDAAALLFLNACRTVDLVGITTVFGNADIDTVTRNALYLKRRFGIDAPVARGAGRALEAEPSPPPVHVHGRNGLGDMLLEIEDLPGPDPRPAHRFIIDLVRQQEGQISIVAVGRLTNLAMALAEAPDIAGLVKEVVVMGGAFGLAGPNGNVTPVAEANIIGDPHAADIVFGTEWPVTAVGLDVTRQVVMGPASLDRLAVGGEAARFIVESTRGYRHYHMRFGVDGFYVHDSSAAAFVVDRSLFQTRRGPIRVATQGVAAGQTVQMDRMTPYPPGAWDAAPDQDVAVSVDALGVRQLILDTLSCSS